MPIVNADGCAIYVEVDGPESAPALMLSNSLGTTLHIRLRSSPMVLVRPFGC